MTGRVIQTKIWQDDFFWALTTPEKLLFIYFLTNPAITIIHLYEVPDRKIMYDTGLDEETLKNAKFKFQGAGKFHFYKSWVYIANAYRYQNFRGPDNETAKLRLLQQTPKDVLDWYYKINDSSVGSTVTLPVTVISNSNSNRNTSDEEIIESGGKRYIKTGAGALKEAN